MFGSESGFRGFGGASNQAPAFGSSSNIPSNGGRGLFGAMASNAPSSGAGFGSSASAQSNPFGGFKSAPAESAPVNPFGGRRPGGRGIVPAGAGRGSQGNIFNNNKTGNSYNNSDVGSSPFQHLAGRHDSGSPFAGRGNGGVLPSSPFGGGGASGRDKFQQRGGPPMLSDRMGSDTNGGGRSGGGFSKRVTDAPSWRNPDADYAPVVGGSTPWSKRSSGGFPNSTGGGGLVREYKCTVCQQQFVNRAELQNHLHDSGHFNNPSTVLSGTADQGSGAGRGGRGRGREMSSSSGRMGGRGGFDPSAVAPSLPRESYEFPARGISQGRGSGRDVGVRSGDRFGRGSGRQSDGRTGSRGKNPARGASTINSRLSDPTSAKPNISVPTGNKFIGKAETRQNASYQQDDTQLEYSDEDSFDENANDSNNEEEWNDGSETSHVSAEDNEDDEDEEQGEESDGNNNTSATSKSFTSSSALPPAATGGGGDWSRGGVVQQAPPGTASSNSLLKRLKKPAPTNVASNTTAEKSSASNYNSGSVKEKAGPTADKPFFSTKFAPKAASSATAAVSFSKETIGGRGGSSMGHVSDYTSGQSGDERSGPTADKPFFSKKFSGQNNTPTSRDLYDVTSGNESGGDFSDSSPMKSMKKPDSALHADGQIVGRCTDMCAAAERAKRVERSDVSRLELPYPKGYSDPSFQGVSVDLSDPSKTFVKKLAKSSAGEELAIPELVRTPPALLKTMRYLQQFVMEKDLQSIPDVRFNEIPTQIEVYLFIWGRVRMIAKDFLLQNYRFGGRNDRYCIECFENIVRWHIMMDHQMRSDSEYLSLHTEQNAEQLNRYLKSLNEMYDDAPNKLDADGNRSLLCPNEGEFRAYYILQQLDNEGQVEAYIPSLSPEVLASAEIQFALDIVAARRTGNYAKFFRLVREGTYLESCSLFRYIGFMRIQALKVMCRIYRPAKQDCRYPILDMQRLMLFDTAEETVDFFEYCNLPVVTGSDDVLYVVLDGRNVVDSLPVHARSGAPVLPTTLPMYVTIEEKNRISRGDVVLGRSGRAAVHYEGSAADEQSFYRSQLLQQRQCAETKPAINRAAPVVTSSSVASAKIDKRVPEDKFQPAEQTAFIKDSPLVSGGTIAATPRGPFSGFPTVTTTSNVGTPSIIASAVVKPPTVGVSAAETVKAPFSFNISAASFQPSEASAQPFVKPPSAQISAVIAPPAMVFKPDLTTLVTSTKPSEKVDAVPTSAPSNLSQTLVEGGSTATKGTPPLVPSFTAFKPPQIPFTFPSAATTVKDLAAPPPSDLSTAVNASTAESESTNKSPIPIKINTSFELPQVTGIGAPSPQTAAAGGNIEKQISDPSAAVRQAISFDQLFGDRDNPAVSSVDNSLSSSISVVKKTAEEFDAVEASVKVVRQVSFTPQLKRFTSTPSKILPPVADDVVNELFANEAAYVSNTSTVEISQVDLFSIPLSEDRVKELMKLEHVLQGNVAARRGYKALSAWHSQASTKIQQYRLKCQAISFNRWSRLYRKRKCRREELNDAFLEPINAENDMSTSMLTPFAHMSVVSSASKARPMSENFMKLSDTGLTVKDFSVAQLVGPVLFNRQTMAFRAALFSKESDTTTSNSALSIFRGPTDSNAFDSFGPYWPRDLFWKLLCVTTDSGRAYSKSGYCRSDTESASTTAVRSMLLASNNITLDDSRSVKVGMSSEDVIVCPNESRRVHVRCADVRADSDHVSDDLSGHAAVIVCPISILRESNNKTFSVEVSSFHRIVRDILSSNSAMEVVLLISVTDSSEQRVWGEIDMDNYARSPPWGITLDLVNGFLNRFKAEGISQCIRGVFAINSAESSVGNSTFELMIKECLNGILGRLCSSALRVSCPLLQRVNVPSWALWCMQKAIVVGTTEVEEAHWDKFQLSDMFKLCIQNISNAVNDCLVRIEDSIENADSEQVSILAHNFAMGHDESIVPNALLDDWEYSHIQTKARLHLQQLLQTFNRSISSVNDAIGIRDDSLQLVSELCRDADDYWQHVGHGLGSQSNVRYGIPASIAVDMNKTTLNKCHDYISAFWLPSFDAAEPVIETDVEGAIQTYGNELKAKGWQVSSTESEQLCNSLTTSNSRFASYCAITSFFYSLVSKRQKVLIDLLGSDADGFILCTQFKAEPPSSLVSPKQLQLLTMQLAADLSTKSRKRPWGGVEGDTYASKTAGVGNDTVDGGARARTRLEEVLSLTECSEAVDSLYQQMYPVLNQEVNKIAAGDGDAGLSLKKAIEEERDSARKLEDKMSSILNVSIPYLGASPARV